jgi:cadherin 23
MGSSGKSSNEAIKNVPFQLPILHSTVPLIVYVKDRNDNVPQFSKAAYNVVVPENVGVGVSIARIEAIDLDSGNYGTQGIRYTGITGEFCG